MRIRMAGLLAILLLSACGSSEPPTSSVAPRDAEAAPQLRRDGRWLVDPQNRVVLVHGVNAVWKLPPYYPPDDAEGFTARDAQWLREQGFNGVRLGVLWAGVMPQEGVIDNAYLQASDRVVQLLAAQKIWTLYDFHQDMMSEEFGGEGVPAWAVEKLKGPLNTLPPPQLGFPFNYFTPQVSTLFDHLWAGQAEVWASHAQAWTAVARRWRDQAYHMGYDLLNEPWAGTLWINCLNPALGGCPDADRDKIQPFMDNARRALRSVDAANLVWFEPQLLAGGSGLRTGFTPVVGESQLGYSFHNYCPHAALLQSGALPIPLDLSQTCRYFIDQVTAQGEAAARRMDAVAAMSEFGASDDLTIIRDTLAAADANLGNWFYWQYKNWRDPTTQSQGSGAQGLFADDTDLSSAKPDKLRLLVRTYPQATAGIPLAMSFDPDSGEFSYRYEPRAAQGLTEIYVPLALHYPQGYQLQLSGALQRSADNAALLLLENVPGAGEVSVLLRPR